MDGDARACPLRCARHNVLHIGYPQLACNGCAEAELLDLRRTRANPGALNRPCFHEVFRVS